MSVTQLSVSEYCDRIKYQHDMVQSQYSTLKIEAEKLKAERTDLQNQSKRFFESAYYLNVQNHKLAEINSRLLQIINDHIHLLPSEAQSRVKSQVEDAKKVSIPDLEKRIKTSQLKSSGRGKGSMDSVESFHMADLYVSDEAKHQNNNDVDLTSTTDDDDEPMENEKQPPLPTEIDLKRTRKGKQRSSNNDGNSIEDNQQDDDNSGVPRTITKKICLPHDSHVSSVLFSSNGDKLFTGSKGLLRMWNMNDKIESKKSTLELKCFGDSFIRTIALNNDNSIAFLSGESKDVSIVDLASGRTVRTLSTDNIETQYSVVLSSDSKYCFSCLNNGKAIMWDVQTGTIVRSFVGHEGIVSRVVLSQDGHTLITSGLDTTVRFWDVNSGKQLAHRNMGGAAFSMASCPQKQRCVAVGLSNGTATVIDYSDLNQEKEYQLKVHDSSVLSLAYSPSGDWMVTGGKDKWWNTCKAPYGPTIVRTKEKNSVISCDISSSNIIATGSFDKMVTLYSADQ